MPPIYNRGLTPLAPPQTRYAPLTDVVEFRVNREGSIAQELFRRTTRTIGFRYCAWVNFSDAGGGAHHMWWRIDPESSLVTDQIDTAREVAQAHASSSGVAFSERQAFSDA